MQAEEMLSSELIWRRLTEPFSEWVIALPVLFALVVLFIVSCLRQDKGIGTLLLGLCMLTLVPACLAYNHKTFGWPPSEGIAVPILLGWVLALPVLIALIVLFYILWQGENKGMGTSLLGLGLLVFIPLMVIFFPPTESMLWLRTVVGTVMIWAIEVEVLLRYVVAGLLVGGFAVNLLREFGAPTPVNWAAGVMFLMMHSVWAFFIGWITSGWKEPLPLTMTPYVLLFLIQCVLSSVKGRTAIGLIVIAVVSAIYIPFAIKLQTYPYLAWWVILVPVLTVALFYVAMMYIRDAKTIHPVWAGFLGLLRCTVYAVLTIVFLLPGKQYFETAEVHPKVLIIFDVSDSMQHRDELANPAVEKVRLQMGGKDRRLTRQDKVLAFLLDAPPLDPDLTQRQAWLDRLLERSPATVYRFGDKPDDMTVHKMVRSPAQAQWLEFVLGNYLNPKIADAKLSDAEKAKPFNKAKAVVAEGKITSVEVTGPESGYKDAPRITAVGEGTETRLEAVFKDGVVTGVTVVEGGKGFTKAPMIYIDKTVKEQEEEETKREKMISKLLNGTDVPGSADQIARLESANFVQAIIIVSDGRSNNPGSSDQSLANFLARVNNPDRKIHVFTVGVGNYQQPVEIKIEEMQSPQIVRPDEKIPVRVPVVASKKLRGETIDMTLEALRIKDSKGNVLYPTWWTRRNAPVFRFAPEQSVLKGDGEFAQTVQDYEIDLFLLFAKSQPKMVMDFLNVTDPSTINYQDLKKQEQGFMRFALGMSGVAVEKMKTEGIKTAFMEKFLEGEWEFNARVPVHKDEVFAEDFHVSRPPALVRVQNKKPKILLFAGGPTRDYQFTRTMLAREAQAKRIELSIYLQSGARIDAVDQDVPAERFLTHFPHRRGPDDPKDKFSSINQYDVIVALDPDWTALNANISAALRTLADNLQAQGDAASAGRYREEAEQIDRKPLTNADQAKLISNWVSREGGGVIFVAGPMNTFELATSKAELENLPKMVPVVLKDLRLFPPPEIDYKTKYPLTFTQQALTTEFLKLDQAPKVDNPTAGWEKFFWGEAGRGAPGEEPERGFFSYYPVEIKRNDTAVLATFSGPKATYLENGDEQPYLATMRYGNGKTIYVGGETWSLRRYKESYHEVFWLGMIRSAMSGTQSRDNFGRWVVARKAQGGFIPVEIQIKEAVSMKGEGDGPDILVEGNPLPKVSAFKPKIEVRKRGEEKILAVFDLKPKAHDGPWLGWWEGKIKIDQAGDYELVNRIFAPSEKNPLTSATLVHQLQIYVPQREQANLYQDFEALKALATDAEPIIARFPEIESSLPPKNKQTSEGRKLFFPIEKADKIPECLLKLEPRKTRSTGRIKDIWDEGDKISLFHLLWSVPLGLFALAGAIMMFHEKWIMGAIALVLAVLTPPVLLVLPWFGRATGWYSLPDWDTVPVNFAFVLVVVVSLLALEWLTRKLLKLA